jgi:hypothetical protein
MKLLHKTLISVKKDIKKFITYLLLLIILYNLIAAVCIGYSKDGLMYTLVLYFFGSEKIDTMFFMWLFLQTVIIAFGIYKIKEEMNSLLVIRILKIGNILNYLLSVIARILIYIIFYYVLLYMVSFLFILFFHELFPINDYLKCVFVMMNSNYFMLFSTGILNTFIFILLICLLAIGIGSLNNSFIILQTFQLVLIFLFKYNLVIFQYLPLCHGIFSLYNNTFTYQFSWGYQMVLATLLVFAVISRIKKNLEKYI